MSEAEAREIVAELRKGVVERPKRWSGDVHADLGGSIDDEATDRIMGRAADEIERLTKELEEAKAVLTELSAMYTHAWDTVDGGLFMMGESIPRFEAAHERARAALAKASAPEKEEIMTKNPTHEEMTTPVEMSDLPHDVLVSVNQHMADGMARGITRDLEAGVYQMKCISEAIEAFRRIVEVSPLAHPHLTNAGIALGAARDELDTYAQAYGVGNTDAMPKASGGTTP